MREVLDTNTPDHGTAVSEWLRQADIRSTGQSVHEVRNLLSNLAAIRYQALYVGWSPLSLASDRECEAHLRRALFTPGYHRQVATRIATVSYPDSPRQREAGRAAAAALANN